MSVTQNGSGGPSGEARPGESVAPVLAQDLLSLLERLGEAVLIVSDDGVVQYASRTAGRVLGVGGDLVGRPNPVADPAPSVLRAADGLSRTLPTPRRRGLGPARSFVQRWISNVPSRDGERRLLVSRGRIRGGGSYAISLIDVTSHDPATSDTERHLEAARRLTGIALWEWHVCSDTLLWSPEMFTLAGLPPAAEAPPHAVWRSWVHPDDRERVAAVEHDAIRRGHGWQVVFRLVPPDGRTRHLRSWCELELDADGTPLKVTGASLDITEGQEAAIELQESRRRLDAAAHLTGLASWSMGLDGTGLWWSDTMFDLYGVASGSWTPTPRGHLELIHPEDRRAYLDAAAVVVSTTQPREITLRIQPPDGGLRYLRCWMDVTCNPAGEPQTVWGTALDITDEERALQSLRDSREEFRLAFDEAPTGMVLVNVQADGSVVFRRANRAMRQLFDIPDDAPYVGHDQTIADTVLGRLAADAQALLASAIGDLLGGVASQVEYELSFTRLDGSPARAAVRAGVARVGGSSQLLLHVRDVTRQHRAKEELEHLAMTDAITGLGNRTMLEKRLREAIGEVEPGRRAVGMLLLDLDRFKVVNDSLGHVTGDRLLVEVAQRLREALPEGACVARLGGDEFAILLDPAPGAADLLGLAHQVRERLARPYSLPSGDFVVCTASIGVTRVEDPTCSVEDVYREADLALYEAKDSGRNGCAISDERMRAKADARIESEHRLRTALEADGIRIHLQPVVDLATGHVEGAEALARLAHPSLGLLPPADFIDVAEDTGLVVDIDVRVAELAVAHLAAHPDDVAWVAVNASPRTLAQSQYTRRVKAALTAHGVSAGRLHVEVTESSLLDEHGSSARGLAALRTLGVQAGIDDFGTGYSALAYLDRFALDFLKIDKSFVARLADAEGPAGRGESLVSAIVALAHVYGMKVTAEGVETWQQFDALRRMGCDHGQGYLFGRPEPVA